MSELPAEEFFEEAISNAKDLDELHVLEVYLQESGYCRETFCDNCEICDMFAERWDELLKLAGT